MAPSFDPRLGSSSGLDTRTMYRENKNHKSKISPFYVKMYINYTKVKSITKRPKDVEKIISLGQDSRVSIVTIVTGYRETQEIFV